MTNRKSLEFILRLTFPVLWALLLLWLSLTPSPPQMPGILGWNKLQHAIAYGLLTLLVAQFLTCLRFVDKNVWWQAGGMAMCYGGLLEILQFLAHTGRAAEWGDLAADAVGALLAGLIIRVAQARVKYQ